MGAGSGPGGRILSTDLGSAQVARAAAPAVASGPQTITLTKMRKAIAKNLLWSKQNIPHFYAKRVVEAEKLFTTYKRTKQDFKCTVNDFVVRACALAIREFAPFRSQYRDDQIVEFPHVNIGVAVGTDDGLLVPVVLDADRSNLENLAGKTRKVVENARAGKLDGVGQGIFTISNMGMFGTEEFSAIVNPPESAILAVGAIREDIKVMDGTIRPTRMMTLTVSVDHRVIDGAVAAQFLNRLKELLEAPEQML
jgi:pyruvate dehydrogenase E2 component (dihydrolipoamide acetyltransferase)